jgi:hypothetical protein
VEITLDRADHHLAERRHLLGDEQRFEEVDTGVHRARRQQHLGQEDLVRTESAADHVHAGQQPLIENLRRARAGIDRLLCKVRNLLVLTPLKALADLLQNVHVTPRRTPGHLTSNHSTTSPLSQGTSRFLSGKPRLVTA